jgi:hypothetical protein
MMFCYRENLPAGRRKVILTDEHGNCRLSRRHPEEGSNYGQKFPLDAK